MNRVEKMKMKKQGRIKRIKNFFTKILLFMGLLTLLYIGLEIVDETNRSMMSMENSCFFSYKKFDENNLEVIFCGDRYLVNTEKVEAVIADVKKKTEDGIVSVKKFAEDRRKILTRLVEDIFYEYQ